MPFVPFPEWLPDNPDYTNPGSSVITNVVPVTEQSYAGMPQPVAYSGALMARCQGSYSVRDNSGGSYIFAGDASRLYLMQAGSSAFADVSKTAGGPYATGAMPDFFWSATSFGNNVLMTNFNDPVQSFLAGTSVAFADLAPTAPKAKFIATIRDFVMAAYTTDPVNGAQPQRSQWCAIADPTNWPTPGTNAAVEVQSDENYLEQTDLGQITGLIGGALSSADGAVFCERGIWRIAYAGSPAIFAFAVAEGAAGTQSPLSVVLQRFISGGVARAVAYYLGEDGFYAFDGISSVPIGAQKIDKTFFRDLDVAYIGYVAGQADPINKLVFWAYHGPQSSGLYNRLLVYNRAINRWSLCDLSPAPGEWITRSLTIGYTLDQLDQFGTLDTLPWSLDSRIWTGGKPILSWFDADHKLAYFTGDNLAPTLDTSEAEIFPGFNAKILGARPMADVAGASIAVATRDRLSDSIAYQAAVPVNVLGDCPQRTVGRYARLRLTLPAASVFSHLQGIDVQAVREGTRPRTS